MRCEKHKCDAYVCVNCDVEKMLMLERQERKARQRQHMQRVRAVCAERKAQAAIRYARAAEMRAAFLVIGMCGMYEHMKNEVRRARDFFFFDYDVARSLADAAEHGTRPLRQAAATIAKHRGKITTSCSCVDPRPRRLPYPDVHVAVSPEAVEQCITEDLRPDCCTCGAYEVEEAILALTAFAETDAAREDLYWMKYRDGEGRRG